MYDLAIIGAGAAGIACAKAALRARLRTVLIEKKKDSFGGTCLNSGCIPTKFFINSSKLRKSWEDSFTESQKIVERIKAPLLSCLEREGVDIALGGAYFLDKNTLRVGDKPIKAKNIIIATGSRAKAFPKHQKVIFTQDLFKQPTLGNKILIVGAGYIGIELASLLQNLRKSVCIVEKENRILPAFDSYLAGRLKAILEKKGIKIDTASDIASYNLAGYDLVISAVGREPNIKGLKIENASLGSDQGGWIKTDRSMRTNVENIYACGDVTGKKLLAYVAEYQAHICISNILGTSLQEDYSMIPECVFSLPQVARIGMLEDEAKEADIKHRVIKSNFLRLSSAYAYDDTDGFIKIVVDVKDRIIGAGIISQLAAEFANTFTICIKNNLTLSDLRKCTLIHPTLLEIIPMLAKDALIG